MTRSVEAVDDRREGHRFTISAPLTVMLAARKISGFTRDLSNRGVYFYIDLADSAAISGDVDFLVALPPEITLSPCCSIRCQGRVLRTDNTSNQMTGIAAEILHYSMYREDAASA